MGTFSWPRTFAIALAAATAVLAGCTSAGTDDPDGAATGAPESPKEQTSAVPATVTGELGAKTLDTGVCAWVETEEGRVEVWASDELGQVFSFGVDDSFEGIRAVDPTDPDGVGEVLFGPGQRVTVTGTTYDSTPECGEYGVEATTPITAD